MEKSLEMGKFVAPEFIFGVGARHLAGRHAKGLGCSKVLLVTDPGVTAAGWSGEVAQSLEEYGLQTAVFSSVSPNPRAKEVMAGTERYREEGCDGIVAVGGGSPMDCAKGIGIVAANGRHILEFEGSDRVEKPLPPLVCVPTTGGTGSEVSQFVIINNPDEGVKVTIVDRKAVPNVALVDPLTLTTKDPFLTACTGLDALTHAIEAYVAKAHSPVTDLHALEAVRLISAHLIATVEAPKDVDRRAQVMLGSLHAGLAFSNASLGAVHAMAHSLGGQLDLPHGACNAILLEHVVAFNWAACPERFERIGEAMGIDMAGRDSAARKTALIARLHALKTKAGIDQTLGSLGVSRSEFARLGHKALQDACMQANPRRATEQDLETIYEESI
ncbi:alcohol dehydrogenase-like regulatory protein ErcA [uncultured Desulfuromonas sp.]|uniref:alcohol dehydrogenase-like regulatory protein ErcA n=1 Tax=uncultured Desulfuromonas sp. TaxID=181013 RepID=UPI0026061CD9|nr:alcohol dehydrogenase-like regulatory protein ErcA [uncultured Desulfuromonas sp.]